MGTFTWREKLPGETMFGGGKGFLIPFRFGLPRSSTARSQSAQGPQDSAPNEAERQPDEVELRNAMAIEAGIAESYERLQESYRDLYEFLSTEQEQKAR